MNRYKRIMDALFEAIQHRPEEESFLSEEELREVEKGIGTALPADYREFLRDYGHSSVQRTFRMSNGELGRIDYFKGINWDRYDLVGNYQMNLSMRPHHILEIGSSDAGTVFLSLREEDKGSVYFWDNWESLHERFEDNLIFVAPSFNDFMNLLRDYS